MSTITLIGAGQMASALTFPLYENGHEVRLVGSPLDDQVIDRLREDNYHVNLLRTLHDGIHYYKESEKEAAIQGSWVFGGIQNLETWKITFLRLSSNMCGGQ